MEFEKIAFVGEDNSGPSQLATALAKHERDRRGLDMTIVTGGVSPSESIQDEVVAVLEETEIEITGQRPREIQNEDMAGTDYVVTMGCSICDFKPAFWRGPAERWELERVDSSTVEQVREQRDEIRDRVEQLFTDLESMMD